MVKSGKTFVKTLARDISSLLGDGGKIRKREGEREGMLTFWPKAPRLTCLSWWWLESRDWWSTRRLKGVEPLQEASSMVVFELMMC